MIEFPLVKQGIFTVDSPDFHESKVTTHKPVCEHPQNGLSGPKLAIRVDGASGIGLAGVIGIAGDNRIGAGDWINGE